MPSYPTNPTAHLRIGMNPPLDRLLRACGVPETHISGGASDYDRFQQLARTLPLCMGHPLRDAVTGELGNATGLAAPLCPHTAPAYWEAWVEKYWYGRELSPTSAPCVKKCPHCMPLAPPLLSAADTVPIPTAWDEAPADLTAWTARIEGALPQNGARAVRLTLPENFTFLRPDPYHADRAIRQVHAGGSLLPSDRDLLIAQAARTVGLAAVRGGFPLLITDSTLHDPDTAAVTNLLTYLDGCRALPRTMVVFAEPTRAALRQDAVSGLLSSVRTGLMLSASETENTVYAKLTAYAAVAPVGRGVLYLEADTPALRAHIQAALARFASP